MNDPLPPMRQYMAALHELYESAVQVGFTPEQAMQIVVTQMATIAAMNKDKP